MESEGAQARSKEGILDYYRRKFNEHLSLAASFLPGETPILKTSDTRALPSLPSLADQVRSVLPNFLRTGRRIMRPVTARFTPEHAQFDYRFVDGFHTVDVSLDLGEIAYCGSSESATDTIKEAEDRPKPLGKALIPVLQDVISAITFSKPVPSA